MFGTNLFQPLFFAVSITPQLHHPIGGDNQIFLNKLILRLWTRRVKFFDLKKRVTAFCFRGEVNIILLLTG